MNKKVFTFSTIIMMLFASLSMNAKSASVDVNGGDILIMSISLNVPDYAQWHYFSFETGTVIGQSDFELKDVAPNNYGTEVPNADWAARTDWDIAFHATDIRTNGAKALFVADTLSTTPLEDVYAGLVEAPKSGYEADELITGTFMQSLAVMPPARAAQMSACKATHGWATFGMSESGLNPMVVVFELASGEYAKVYLKEFFDAEDKPGYIEMEYATIPAAGTSGVNNVTEVKFSIYPNPTTDVLNVELPASANNTTIVVYSLTGVTVKQVQAKAGVNSISVSDLSAGTYFVKADNQVQKFIVK